MVWRIAIKHIIFAENLMKMKKPLPKGISDFKTIIRENGYYVDKSLAIKEVIDDISQVVLLPRPRRFGKTLFMSMLSYFFDQNHAGENRELFNGLNIQKETVFETHQGKYPVIFISFKDIKSSTFDETLEQIQELLGDVYAKFSFLLESNHLSSIQKEQIETIINYKANKKQLGSSLRNLTSYLFDHFKQKPILLIDEYDTPIHSAYTEKYYEPMILFMRNLLSAALKDNVNLHKGVLTGTLRISQESIFTGLNNPSVYSLLNSEFNTCFGFTPEELDEMLAYYELEHLGSDIQKWYNGYIFGGQEIYNPWSIIKFVASKDKQFIPHWVNTSSNDLIKELIIDSPSSVRLELHELLKGKPILKTLEENTSFPNLKKSADVIFSFLVFSGYLKAKLSKFEDNHYWYSLMIPNMEVKELFRTIIMRWLEDSFENEKYTNLLKSLTCGDIESFELIMNEFVISSLSFHHVQKPDVERVYQAFVLGLLVSLSNRYDVSAERESGFGRYDIALVPNDKNKKAIIMEFKKINDLNEETKDQALASALQQIEVRHYEAGIRQRGYHDILKLAVVFDGKRVWVKA